MLYDLLFDSETGLLFWTLVVAAFFYIFPKTRVMILTYIAAISLYFAAMYPGMQNGDVSYGWLLFPTVIIPLVYILMRVRFRG